VEPIISERRLAGSSGVPIEVSRKGKASPLEAGRGKYSPPANPIGSLRKPWSEGIMGSTHNSGNSRNLCGVYDLFNKSSRDFTSGLSPKPVET